jgi:hypothetical protein
MIDKSLHDNWPQPDYFKGKKDHLHALGVVAALYNDLEFSLFSLFYMYSGLTRVVAQPLFENMSNSQRLDFLTRCVETSNIDDTSKELANHFIKCFSICAENRNFLMHSTINTNHELDIVIFSKASREDPNRLNSINADLATIRKVADIFNEIDNFGVGVFFSASQKLDWEGRVIGAIQVNGAPFAPPSPQKPSLPSKLFQLLPIAPKRPKRRRESSRQRRESASKR